MPEELTTESLLDGLRNADDGAWRRFEDLFRPMLQGWLVRRGVQSADADDLLQDVVQIALRELPHFQHRGPGSFRAWLRVTVSNRLRALWRKRSRGPVSQGNDDEYGDLADQLADPHSDLSRIWDEEYQHDTCQRLLRMVEGEFQPNTLRAFVLLALDGKKLSEVAEELGMSTNAAAIAHSRVLQRMRVIGRGMID